MAEYIEREALLQQLEMAIECKDCPRNADRKTYYDRCACSEIQDICDAITEAPKADVQPVKRGRWEYIRNVKLSGTIKLCECSICHNKIFGGLSYCGNCGARMDGEQNENN